MENDNIYANVTPTPAPQAQPYQQQAQPYQQAPQAQPYQPQGAYYSQTVGTAPVYNTNYQQAPMGTKCPGKEIAGLVLGINSLVWGVLGALFGWVPYVGIMYALIWGGFGLGFGIAAIILHKKVHEQATYITKKIEIGKKLAVAGIIVSCVGAGIAIIMAIVYATVLGSVITGGSLLKALEGMSY